MPHKSARLSLRLVPSEYDVVELAARLSRTNLSEFVRTVSLRSAQAVIARLTLESVYSSAESTGQLKRRVPIASQQREDLPRVGGQGIEPDREAG